ncbi:hypothetical protein C2845_PM03G31750 [Panicum miliaceum]|uniref:Uncharacterized protein n=1 Tax=Panicum miliaceum TaxID=4540 RepID=A0A3L6TFX6_PANMI|nr:hypothetical protein C2845_PM03G31750 [Panicum miliaceum]
MRVKQLVTFKMGNKKLASKGKKDESTTGDWERKTINLEDWNIVTFSTKVFWQWWSEWSLHLFCGSAKMYCQKLDPSFAISDDEDLEVSPVSVNNSGRPTKYAPPSESPHIGHKALSLKYVAAGRSKRKATSVKKPASKRLGQRKSPSAQTVDPQMPTPPSTILEIADKSQPSPTTPPRTASSNSPLDEHAKSASTELQSSAAPATSSAQAQDTPDNRIFLYQIDDFLKDEEITSRAITLGEVSGGVKIKLHDILQLLNQDNDLLVQDAEGIRRILNHLKGQLLADVESALIPAAFIEGHRCEVFKAQNT